MLPSRTPRHPLRSITRSRAKFTLRDQVLQLRGELLRALGQAIEFRDRNRALALELAEVKARAADQSRALRARNAVQTERFRATWRELVHTRAEARAERSARRLEVFLLQTRCQALEARCRAFALTIQRTRASELDVGAPTQLPPHTQGSA
jgi:hypothetical protein